MENEQRFWLTFWFILGFVFLSGVGMTFYYVAAGNARQENAIVALVDKGMDPIIARCTITPPETNNAIGAALCALAVAAGK